MHKPGELVQAVEREISASSTKSAIPPGSTKPDPALVEAINQVFALFRLNYHNQYYAAFSEVEQLRQIKKLWLESLREFPPAQILQGARRVIETSEYLPTLSRMRSCCESSLAELGLPDARDAYLEACNAGSPPELGNWSHAIVYWAGRDCGWRFLAEEAESRSWPVFNSHYQARSAAVLAGEVAEPVPAAAAQRALPSKPLEGQAALTEVRKLRSLLEE